MNLTKKTEEKTVTHSLPRLKIFPNPSSNGLVNFQISNGQRERLQIYDASGRKIKETEIQTQLKIKLPSGIYFYRIQAEGLEDDGFKTVETGKMVLLK